MGGNGMSIGSIVSIVIILLWFIRLEINIYNLQTGRHYELYDENGFPISHLNSDGTLSIDIISSNIMSYKTASGIKKLYPEITMIDIRTGKEVAE